MCSGPASGALVVVHLNETRNSKHDVSRLACSCSPSSDDPSSLDARHPRVSRRALKSQTRISAPRGTPTTRHMARHTYNTRPLATRTLHFHENEKKQVDSTGCVRAEPIYSRTSWTALALEVGKSPTEVPPGRRRPPWHFRWQLASSLRRRALAGPSRYRGTVRFSTRAPTW